MGLHGEMWMCGIGRWRKSTVMGAKGAVKSAIVPLFATAVSLRKPWCDR